MKGETEVIHVRLPKDLVKQIDHLAVDEEAYRQDVMSRLLAAGLNLVKTTGHLPAEEPRDD